MAGMLELTDWEFKTVNIWYAKGYNKLHAATDVTTKIVKMLEIKINSKNAFNGLLIEHS